MHDKGAHLMDLHHKRGEDELDYFIDLARWLEPDEAIIASRAWAEVTASDTPDVSPLFPFRVEFAATGVVVWLRSGADGQRYVVSCLIQTDRGKVKLIRFVVVTRGFGDGSQAQLLLPIMRASNVTITLIQSPITLAPPSFGIVAIGGEQLGEVTITNNTSLSSLVITGISGSGDFAPVGPWFGGLPRTIGAGESAVFQVRFAPTATGFRVGVITIVSSAPGGPVTLTVTGMGAPAGALLLGEGDSGFILEGGSGFLVGED